MSTFFQIPGNIKQQFIPFVLNPKSSQLQHNLNNSTQLAGCGPQYFSYKAADSGHLQFYPSSIDSIKISDDIAFKMLYKRNQYGNINSQPIGIADILNSVPGVQIREFLPDTRLDQCINIFIDFFKSMSKLFTGDDDKSGTESNTQTKPPENDKSLFDKITAAAWFTVKYMVGMTKENLYSSMHVPGGFTTYPEPASGSPEDYVLTFPYNLYYRLQSCTTTNIYEVPGISEDKAILHSGDGMAGWTGGGDDIMSAGGFRLSNLLGKIPVVGTLANMILGNIAVNYLPWWEPNSGSKTKEPQVNIKFDLFNDSAEAAMMNFIFVNTIVPNNKWIQYNMFQHSSNLYDVKIEGINRLFACAGNFSVTYDGVLRDPPLDWVKTLCKLHRNPATNSNIQTYIIRDKLIKIPDVYKVSLSFQSLLPANFNNYIYSYAKNSNIKTEYSNTGYTSSLIGQAIDKGLKTYSEYVKNVWDTANDKLYDKDTTESSRQAALSQLNSSGDARMDKLRAEKQTAAKCNDIETLKKMLEDSWKETEAANNMPQGTEEERHARAVEQQASMSKRATIKNRIKELGGEVPGEQKLSLEEKRRRSRALRAKNAAANKQNGIG